MKQIKIKLNKYQRLLWKYANLYPDHFYNLGLSFRFTETLDPILLQDSFYYLVNSVDILHSLLIEDKNDLYFETQNDLPFEFSIEEIASEKLCEIALDRFTQSIFDLYTQRPIRAKLYKLPNHSYVLVIVFHHICIDGTSVTDLLNLLAQIYNERLQDNPYPQLQLSTFREYDQLLQKSHQYAYSDICLEHWSEIFKDKQLNLTFPGITRRQTNYEFKDVRFELGTQRMKEIIHIGRRLGTTTFLVILSAWMYVLHRFSNQTHILVDSAINLRPSRLKNLIGFFVNNLPLLSSFEKGLTCKELILQLTKQRKKLKLIQSYTLDEVIPLLQTDNHEIISGHINVGMNFVEWGDSIHIPLQGTECHFHRRIDKYSSFDLLLEVDPNDNGLARICYSPEFPRPYIETLINSLKQVLDHFSNQLLSDLSEICLLSSKQLEVYQQEVETHLNRLSPINDSINTRFEQIARRYKDHPALIYNNTSISYEYLYNLCEQNAHKIRERFSEKFQHDMPTGEPIGIYTSDKRKAIIWLLSILKAGGTYVNFELDYPVERIRFIMEDYEIRHVLSDSSEQDNVFPAGTLLTSLSETRTQSSNINKLPTVPQNTNAYIISTSGTTGLPKGVPITHRQVLQLLQSKIMAKKQQDVVLQYASLCFDASVWEIFSTLLVGATLIIANEEERISPKALSDLLQNQSVTTAWIPPVMLSELPHYNLPQVEKLYVAGDTTPKHVIDYWQKGRTFINAYGPTECTVCATACVMNDETFANDIGCPIEGIACYILDQNRHLLPPFIRGELCIGGPQVSKGYIKREELNREKFIKNPYQTEEDKRIGRNAILYRTGDLVSRLPNGHILFHGRIDFQVKIHGFRIELEEIENALNQHPDIKKSVVIVRDYQKEKKLIAYVQTDQVLSSQELRQSLAKTLPHYMIPSGWTFRPSFALTTSGKIDRKQLPEPDMLAEFPISLAPPQTREERLLLDIIASTCHIEQIGVETDLFDLGISSIQIMMIASEAALKGLDLSISTFYKERTIRRIVQNSLSSICFWGNTYDEGKPIMVLVCGEADFNTEYQAFIDIFGEEYSILVLDSIHEYARQEKEIHWNQLIDTYTSLLKQVVIDKEIKVIAGFCIGGEIGLGIANKLVDKGETYRPELLLLDSFSKRDKQLEFEYTDVAQSYAKKRNETVSRLLQNQKIETYPGKVTLFLASQFTSQRLDLKNPDTKERAYRQFQENAKYWQELVPHCQIFYLDTNHWEILQTAFLSQIKDIYSANKQ